MISLDISYLLVGGQEETVELHQDCCLQPWRHQSFIHSGVLQLCLVQRSLPQGQTTHL